MDKNMDYNYFGMPPFGNSGMYDMNTDYGVNNGNMNPGIDPNAMFNPLMQYEQAYSYYKYLCMQMDYKIKCKEYEKMCSANK